MSNIVREPRIDYTIQSADLNVNNEQQKILFIGQKLTTGSAVAGTLITEIGNDGQEKTIFGAYSHLANMLSAAKRINTVSRMDAIALDDAGGGTAAAGSVAFAGTATVAGTITVIVGSSTPYEGGKTYVVSVNSGATAAVVGTALYNAIVADNPTMVTATDDTEGEVTLTCRHKGTLGNFIGLEAYSNTAGITITLTGMTGGATDPTLTNVLDLIANERYQTIVWPTGYSTTLLKAFLDARFNVNGRLLDGLAIIYDCVTQTDAKTRGAAFNSNSIVYGATKKLATATKKHGAIFQHPDFIAANLAALRALRLTDGANIARYVTGFSGQRDNFGGVALATLPYHNTPMPYLPTVPTNEEFTDTETQELWDNGVYTMGNNIPRTTLIMDKFITTYRTNAQGTPDLSYKYVNYVDTITNAREYFYNNLFAQFSQVRLTQGDRVPGRKMVDATSIGSTMDGLYKDLTTADYALCPAGPDAAAYFKQNRNISIDFATGKALITFKLPILTQLREIDIAMQMAFTI